MILFVDLFLNDLAGNIHCQPADLVLDLIDCFFALLRDIGFRLCLDAGGLCLCLLHQFIGASLRLFLCTLHDSGSLFARICNAGLVLVLQIVSFFFGLTGIPDLLVGKIFSLFKDLIDRFKEKSFDQIELDHQVQELGDHSPRYKCNQWLCIHTFPPWILAFRLKPAKRIIPDNP